jgi:hypothetical protein
MDPPTMAKHTKSYHSTTNAMGGFTSARQGNFVACCAYCYYWQTKREKLALEVVLVCMRVYKSKVLLGNDSFGLSLTVWFGFFSST